MYFTIKIHEHGMSFVFYVFNSHQCFITFRIQVFHLFGLFLTLFLVNINGIILIFFLDSL